MSKPHIATYYHTPGSCDYFVKYYGVWRCRSDYIEGKKPMKRAKSLLELKEFWYW